MHLFLTFSEGEQLVATLIVSRYASSNGRLGDLTGCILGIAQRGDPLLRNVKPDDRLELFRQGEGDRQTDIAEADDRKSAFH